MNTIICDKGYIKPLGNEILQTELCLRTTSVRDAWELLFVTVQDLTDIFVFSSNGAFIVQVFKYERSCDINIRVGSNYGSKLWVAAARLTITGKMYHEEVLLLYAVVVTGEWTSHEGGMRCARCTNVSRRIQWTTVQKGFGMSPSPRHHSWKSKHALALQEGQRMEKEKKFLY